MTWNTSRPVPSWYDSQRNAWATTVDAFDKAMSDQVHFRNETQKHVDSLKAQLSTRAF